MKFCSFRSRSELVSALKISGFVELSEPEVLPLSDGEQNADNLTVVKIECKKPNFEARIDLY